MNTKLTKQTIDLKKLDKQRKAWLMLSAFVMAVVSFIIFDYVDIIKYGLIWQISIAGITLSVIWWYWAMRLIGIIIMQRAEEIEMLRDLYESIYEVKDKVIKKSDEDI